MIAGQVTLDYGAGAGLYRESNGLDSNLSKDIARNSKIPVSKEKLPIFFSEYIKLMEPWAKAEGKRLGLEKGKDSSPP